jgi:hypothetical protein
MAISKEDFCNTSINKALSLNNELNSLINMAQRKHINDLTSNINSMLSNPLSDLSDLESQSNSLLDDLTDQGELSNLSIDDDAKTIVECLGFPLEGNILGDLPSFSLNNLFKGYLDSQLNNLTNMLDSLLDPLEKAIGEGFSTLENLIPSKLLDELLGLLQCLSNCSNTSSLPSMVEIEEQLESIGLNINGEIDFSSSVLSSLSVPEATQSQFKNIGNIVSSVNNKTKDLLKNSPF